MSLTNPSGAATVGITTRDRCDTARAAIESAIRQEPAVDVLVLDDASSDGTSEMVRSEFPRARLIRTEQRIGYIEGRMRIFREAETPIVCILDDDATFSTPAVVRETVADFDHSRIAAVAVPMLEHGSLIQGTPGSRDFRVTDFFIGAAHAVRREIVLAQGGFRTSFFFYCEEPDFCIRLLQSGYVTRVGRSDPIIHSPHPARNFDERFAQRIKNELRFKWYHTPSIYLPAALAAHVIGSARAAVHQRFGGAFLLGMTRGFRELIQDRKSRNPIDLRVYKAWRMLRKGRSIPFEQIEPLLPSMTFEPTKGIRHGFATEQVEG
jgi:GT2 family glycosyltransferase